MKSLKVLLHFLLCFLSSFAAIYAFVFLGGWRLFEGGDPILLEIAAALGAAFLLLIIFEITSAVQSRMRELEKRITEIENR